jgi:glycosyltransferase involved in cell wall biosynthesis
VLQINTTLNTTSTGRIAEEIGQTLIQNGHESYIASAQLGPGGTCSEHIPIGNEFDIYMHGMKSRLLDRHGFGSNRATTQLVEQIKRVDPDVIGLHNLHGYYLNVEVLFTYLKQVQKPVVWTFHDCWPFTGHCSFFDFVGCEKWKTECYDCPLSDKYPASWFMDNSTENFHQKRALFNGLEKLVIVTPSRWLKDLVGESFLSSYPVKVIHNGIDLEQFRPVDTDIAKAKYGVSGRHVILGVASVWDRRKGLGYFVDLSKRLGDRFKIILVGLAGGRLRNLADNIMGIPRTESVEELVALYNIADVFVNPTMVDNFPTTNLEALACGTPVITFDTGGSPEAISAKTGRVVVQKNVDELYQSVMQIAENGKDFYKPYCRARAIAKYDKKDRFAEYVQVYKELAEQSIAPNSDEVSVE